MSLLSPYAASKKAKVNGLQLSQTLSNGCLGGSLLYRIWSRGKAGHVPLGFIKWIAEGEIIQIFGDGSQSRDFTYVDDIASGTVAAIQDVGYEIINLGGGRNPVSLNAIIEKFRNLDREKSQN